MEETHRNVQLASILSIRPHHNLTPIHSLQQIRCAHLLKIQRLILSIAHSEANKYVRDLSQDVEVSPSFVRSDERSMPRPRARRKREIWDRGECIISMRILSKGVGAEKVSAKIRNYYKLPTRIRITSSAWAIFCVGFGPGAEMVKVLV